MKKLITHQRKFLIIWRLLSAVVGGVASSLAFPRENIAPLIFVSVILLYLSIYRTKHFVALGIGFVGGAAFYLSQIEWLSLYLGPVPWLALSILEAAIFALGMGAISLVWQFCEAQFKSKNVHVSRLITSTAIALVWTAREWVSISLPYGGFPWSRLAQTQSDSFLGNWVYWGGFSWLSFVLALVSAVVAVILVTESRLLSLAGLKRNIAALLTLAIAMLVPGLTRAEAHSTDSLRIAAVQGNANAGLFANTVRGSILQNHLDASLLIGDQSVDLVVWPENASDLSPFASTQAKSKIQDFVDEQIQVPLIFGTITQRGNNIYNSSILWKPRVGPTDWYDKKRPVPFAEYVPDRDFWYQLAPDLIGLISRGYSFGERDGIFEIQESKVGALICFEIAIDDISRDLVDHGAQVILSQTNNADFGRSDETYQQAALARLRAIETGRTVINISTVGVSAIYTASGEILQQLPPFEAGVMIQDIPLSSNKTPAMIYGRWIDLTLNLLALGLVLRTIIGVIKKEDWIVK